MSVLRKETIAIHGGFDRDPTTKAVAVPIYQTVAYAFDSADHGAALFNLEVEGYPLQPDQQPDHRRAGAARRGAGGRRAALASAPARRRSITRSLNLADRGGNIVSVPQLYGTTHTLFAHVLPSQGISVPVRRERPRRTHRAADRRRTRARCSARASAIRPATSATSRPWPRSRTAHGVPLIVDNTVATPILLRPIEYGADIVVHSLTKFMGGHGTTLGGAHRR